MNLALIELVKYDNVEIICFDDAFEVTTNLNLYSDTIHYDESVNVWMLNEVSDNKHIVNRSNCKMFCNSLYEYYLSYKYDLLNEFISK